MTGDEPANMPPYAPVPPIQPGEMYLPPQPSAWPKVIGIIAIVLGALAILGACSAAAAPFLATAFKDAMADVTPQGQPSPLASFEMMAQHKTWTVGSQLVIMGLATLLLFVGIGLVKRRRWPVSAARYWAVLKILFGVVYSILGYQIMKPDLDQVVQQASGVPGVGGGFFEGLVWASIAFSILWYSAFPVFLLIWFSRATIKDEVAGWS